MASQAVAQLMEAEKQAQEIVNKAKRERVALLKSARDEAKEELVAYKAERDHIFQEFCAQHTGDAEQYTAQMRDRTAKQVALIKDDTAKNGDKVMNMLLNIVCDPDLVENH
ncbi:V-type H+-transporting ATPase subunit G [Pelomyxa schiedti]|nr:V-type H+-transporting ATPase subunit G [Pelomyxa schiedti]